MRKSPQVAICKSPLAILDNRHSQPKALLDPSFLAHQRCGAGCSSSRRQAGISSSDDGRFNTEGLVSLPCATHQQAPPGKADTDTDKANLGLRLQVLRWHTLNTGVSYCDGQGPTSTDKKWAALVVSLGGSRSSVAPSSTHPENRNRDRPTRPVRFHGGVVHPTARTARPPPMSAACCRRGDPPRPTDSMRRRHPMLTGAEQVFKAGCEPPPRERRRRPAHPPRPSSRSATRRPGTVGARDVPVPLQARRRALRRG